MAKAQATKAAEELMIERLGHRTITVRILGTSPIICNRMSEKAKHELLMPKGKKTAADKAANLKHDPRQEYVDSPYLDPDPHGPTLLMNLAAAFKCGMRDAALDVSGTSKAQIGRLLWVNGERLPMWGVPKLFMSVVRSADMNRTPDIRTRAIVPEWAMEISISYAHPVLNDTAVLNLLATGGVFQGLGDWRVGKGKGNYGQFVPVAKDSPEEERWERIVKTGGRQAQRAALDAPEFHDEDSEEMYNWFLGEVTKRGRQESLRPAADDVKPKGRKKAVPAEANGAAE